MKTVQAYPEFNGRREVLEVATDLFLESLPTRRISGQVHECRCDETFLALDGADDLVRELDSRISHRKGGRARPILCLDNLVTTELDAIRQLL